MNAPTSPRPAVALAVFTGLNLLNYIDRYVIAAVATPMKSALGLDNEQYGRLATAFMLGYFVTAPLFGYLGDRRARRWLIVIGIVGWSVFTGLSGLAAGFGVMLFYRAVVGVGEASYGTLSPGWIADLYPPGGRNHALAIFYLAIPVGAALAFKLGGWMATSYSWRLAFVWAGAPGLLLALCVPALREPARGASESAAAATPPAGRSSSAYRQLLAFRPYVLVVAGYVGYTFAMGGFVNWAGQFLEHVHGLSLKAADDFFGLCVVVTGLIATITGGWVATRWQRRHPAGAARLLALSAVLAVPAVFAAFAWPSLAGAKVALVASMFLLFLSTGPVNTVILEAVPATMRAAAMAASIFAIHFGGDLWSPWVIGALAEKWHDLHRAVLWTMPPAIAVCAFFWCWLAWRMGSGAKAGVEG